MHHASPSIQHKPKRLLITGGAGFIGVNLVRHWQAVYPDNRLVILDSLTYAGSHQNIQAAAKGEAVRFVHGDINNDELVVKLLHDEQIDTIINLAAHTHVDRSLSSPDPFIHTNVLGTHALLKAAKAVWLDGPNPRTEHRFHHVSTDEVYGTLPPNDPPWTESCPYAPNSPYAASKAAADHLVRAYRQSYGLKTTLSRSSNNYGPYQFPEKLIPLAIVCCLTHKPIPIYGDGSQLRDWLYVTDHCRGLEQAVIYGKAGEDYNFSASNESTNLALIKALCRTLDKICPAVNGTRYESLIHFVNDRPGHDARYALDTTKARTELGYGAETQLSAGLTKTVEWYVSDRGWEQQTSSQAYQAWVKDHYPSLP